MHQNILISTCLGNGNKNYNLITREASQRSVSVVSHESIIGVSADDVRPFVRLPPPVDLENSSTDFDERAHSMEQKNYKSLFCDKIH